MDLKNNYFLKLFVSFLLLFSLVSQPLQIVAFATETEELEVTENQEENTESTVNSEVEEVGEEAESTSQPTIEELEKQKEMAKYITIKELFQKNLVIDIEPKRLPHFLNGVKLTMKKTNGVYRIFCENRFIGIGIVEDEFLKRDIILD